MLSVIRVPAMDHSAFKGNTTLLAVALTRMRSSKAEAPELL